MAMIPRPRFIYCVLPVLGASLLFADEETDEPEVPEAIVSQRRADVETEDEYGFCLWLADFGTIYENRENRFIQQFSIAGGIDLQHAAGFSNQGDYGTRDVASEDRLGPVEVRRFRLGWTSDLLNDFKLDGHFNLGATEDVYGSIYQMYLEWRRHQAFMPSIGKMRVPFTQEYTISDREIVTIERSLLVQLMQPVSLTGVSAAGNFLPWSYYVGIYAGDERDEFSEFNQGAVFLSKVVVDLADQFDRLESFKIGADYRYNSSPENTGPGPYRHAFALHGTIDIGRVNLISEIIYGVGFDDVPDIYGIDIIPSAFIYGTQLELVGRYQFAASDGEGGLRLHPRYERLAPDLMAEGVGRRYHAFYGGLNWYFCYPDVKLMFGAEYHDMDGGAIGDDFSGVTLATALRFWF